MSDHKERACTNCGSLLHHEDDCTAKTPDKSLKDNSIPDDVKKQIVDFGVWYSGMAKEKVVRAYNRYLAEKYVPETEEDYKLAQYESKHELPPSPIETPSKALSDLKAENERLKGLIESIYQAGKYAGHHYSGSEEERYWAKFKAANQL